MTVSFLSLPAVAQWELQDSTTKQELYAVSSPAPLVGWASGSHGTVVRTMDGGHAWQACAAPAGAEKRELRSVQAVDASTAVVMSSGKGDASALYRTTDGCATWTKVFANPEAASSFDSLRRVTAKQMYLLGEPVAGKFAMYLSQDAGATWFIADDPGLEAVAGESAATSTMSAQGPFLMFGTSASAKGYVHFTYAKCGTGSDAGSCAVAWGHAEVPMAAANAIGARMVTGASGRSKVVEVAVGDTVAISPDGGEHWVASMGAPHGVQQAVGYSGTVQRWISVGPEGTQISKDDGRSWSAVKAGSGAGAEIDKGWNALALPFVVGGEGRIGVLRPAALE